MDEEKKMTPIEQMNQAYDQREKAIHGMLKELNLKRQELVSFQNELVQKTNELLDKQTELEKKERMLNEKEEQLNEKEHEYEQLMDALVQEKAKVVVQGQQQFLRDLDFETGNVTESSFDLNALRQSIGIDVPKFGTEEGTIETNAALERTVQTEEGLSIIPNVFLQMEKEITKSYPRWNKLELLPERYCLQIGDKEIRFFDADENNPVPRVVIVVFRKNARVDKRLINNIAGIERIAPDWSIEVEENQFVCTMHFTTDTKASVVLKKCNDFIKNHLI